MGLALSAAVRQCDELVLDEGGYELVTCIHITENIKVMIITSGISGKSGKNRINPNAPKYSI